MEFSEAEEYVLFAIKRLIRHQETPTIENLELVKQRWLDESGNWQEALESLMAKGLVTCANGVYGLTEQADEQMQQIAKKDFGDAFVRNEQSPTYATFCEWVYGKHLCQCNMMTMAQLEKFLDVLSLDEHNRVLEMGCGIGTITDTLSGVEESDASLPM